MFFKHFKTVPSPCRQDGTQFVVKVLMCLVLTLLLAMCRDLDLLLFTKQ